MNVVIFNPTEFREVYPEFATMTDKALNFYFEGACGLLDNTDNSMVTNLVERKILLYYLVCHLATLAKRGNDNVGRIMSANEGSVSISFGALRDENWFTQTRCGAMFWEMTKKYRHGVVYIPHEVC